MPDIEMSPDREALPPASLAQGARRATPANIVWRFAQGLLDDIVVTSTALLIAWALGLVPDLHRLLHIRDEFGSVAGGFGWIIQLTAKAGAVMAIYAVVKLAYFVGFVATIGRTPACIALGLQITMTDGSPVTFGGAFKRAIAGSLISHTPIIGHVLRAGDYLVALVDRRKRAARDLVAGTMLIHAQHRWSSNDG